MAGIAAVVLIIRFEVVIEVPLINEFPEVYPKADIPPDAETVPVAVTAPQLITEQARFVEIFTLYAVRVLRTLKFPETVEKAVLGG